MKDEILARLREGGGGENYISGQELCERYGVSRTAVWKAVEALKAEGYEIEAVRNRGYRLLEEHSDVFGQRELESRMREAGTKRIGCRIRFYDEIGSTNLQAKQEAEGGAPEGTLIAADCQTAGRGRRGRAWVSPAGKNIYFSLMLRPEIAPEQAPMLTILMAVAVKRAVWELRKGIFARSSLRETGMQPDGESDESVINERRTLEDPVDPEIKWPNDLVIGGKKVCGILTEMSAERDYIQYVVIGVGINVKRQEFPEEVREVAASLEEAWDADGRVKRSALVAGVCREFEALYEEFIETRDLEFLREEYDACLVNRGREVCVLDPRGEYHGTARGIGCTGELLVELADGEVREVRAGEVSVRGVYGYV